MRRAEKEESDIDRVRKKRVLDLKTHEGTEEVEALVEFDAVPISALESKALVVPASRDQTSPFMTCSRKVGS